VSVLAVLEEGAVAAAQAIATQVAELSERLAVLPQYLLPKRMLTVFAGRCAASRARWWTRRVIPWFIARYGVNMAEAVDPGPTGYASFNEFFTRALRDGARPLAQADFVSPVDGAVIQCGAIDGDQLLQAKGHRYSTRALVGGDLLLASQFDDGQFATLYLSPRDYHRIHMPCDGRLLRMIHVPGDLFSVNPATARGVPGLFSRNERVVCVFESARGLFLMALVGATIVGSIATVWHGVVNPPRPGTVRDWRYDDQNITLRQGDEMGRFLLGSTVVMLFPKDMLRLRSDWVPARTIQMGEAMARASCALRVARSAR
jgi:phosphatidylserine decarboxylase